MTETLELFGSFYRAIRFALPERRAVLLIVTLTLLIAAANAAEPLLLKVIFDGLTGRSALGALGKGLSFLAMLALAREGAQGFSDWLTWRTRLGLQYALLEATVGKLHNMPLRLQRSEGVGAIMTRLDRSIQGLIGAVAQILFSILPAVLFLAMAIAIMFRLDSRLAALVLVFAPMPALIALRAAPEQVRRERSLLDRWARIYSRFNEVLSGILIVRSFTMEETEKNRFLRDVAEANSLVIRGVATDTGYGAASNFVVATARLSALAVGSYLVVTHDITVGAMARREPAPRPSARLMASRTDAGGSVTTTRRARRLAPCGRGEAQGPSNEGYTAWPAARSRSFNSSSCLASAACSSVGSGSFASSSTAPW